MRNFGRKYQGGWIQLVAAAISAAAAAKAASDARRTRLANQAAADAANASGQSNAENFIQMRVADAKKAGIHPLYALQGGGGSYSPAIQSFQYDPRPTMAMADAINRGVAAGHEYFTRPQGKVTAGEPEPVPTYRYNDDFWPAPGEASFPDASVSLSRRSLGIPDPAPFGLVSGLSKASMAYWDVPQLGRIIAPEASNFSESLEGLESPIGQGLILYLNRNQGERVLTWLGQRLKLLSPTEPLSSGLERLSKSRAWSDPLGAGADVVKEWLDSHRR